MDLHHLTQVLDPNPAANEDLGARVQRRQRSGVIDLSALATFQDNDTFRSDSRLAATNGGTVNAPLLTSLDNVSMASSRARRLRVVHGHYRRRHHIGSTNRTFTNLTDIDSYALLVSGDATLSLPDHHVLYFR